MIKVIKNYSEIPDEQQLLKMIGKQMSHIGSSAGTEGLRIALGNALKSESRVYLFVSLSEDEQLQGFAFCNICSGLESGADYLWVNELHIGEEFRRKGLADELLGHIEHWSGERDIPYMACVTSSANIPAQRFYKKRGFDLSPTLWVDKSIEPNCSESAGNSDHKLKQATETQPGIQNLLKIRPLGSSEEPPMDLLLNADPSKELVQDYLSRGLCLIAEMNHKALGTLLLMPTEADTMEIMNVSVSENVQNQGIGTALIYRAIEEARKEKAAVLEIGTGNPGFGQLYLYQKCGFRITGVDPDFFRRNYPERIYENGLECRDMIRLSLELK